MRRVGRVSARPARRSVICLARSGLMRPAGLSSMRNGWARPAVHVTAARVGPRFGEARLGWKGLLLRGQI